MVLSVKYRLQWITKQDSNKNGFRGRKGVCVESGRWEDRTGLAGNLEVFGEPSMCCGRGEVVGVRFKMQPRTRWDFLDFILMESEAIKVI